MKTINNYKITSQIAEGGMGVVYYGEHITLNRPVAIKQLNSTFTNNPHFKDRFINEARILAQLNHPNIISIYDLIEENGSFYIIMEYIQGDTIDNIMKSMRSPFQLQRALNIFIQTLKAFAYAHSKGIIHRDIKPSNIILDEKDTPKVLDFGIAKIVHGDLNLTKAGTKMGSLFYMSPEQVLGNSVDQRSDIYALGIVLFELLTNSLPYALKTDTEFEIMQAIVNQNPVDLSVIRTDIPKSISSVILKACQKDASMRFSSCEEFESALLSDGLIMTDIPLHMPPENASVNSSNKDRTIYQSPGQNLEYAAPNNLHRRNKTLLLLASIVSVIAIFVVLYLFVFNNSKDEIIVDKRNADIPPVQNTQTNSQSSVQSNPNQQVQKNSNYPGEYPEGSMRYLTDEDVRTKTKYQLGIMRNEIFARHGYVFKTNKEMIEYFGKLSWYSPQYNDVTNMLSDIENSNIKLIKKYEK